MKDEIFKKNIKKQFEFDEAVASVFDDMISRSVPFYEENTKLICNLINKIAKNDAKICDLGCATANFLIKLYQLNQNFKLSGIDDSIFMLKNAKNKSKALNANIRFFNANLIDFDFDQNDIFVANYTIQFIRPPQRQSLINKIYDRLFDGGFFIMSEKILFDDNIMAKNMIELYYDYKHNNGYSYFEIGKKRQALENILVPYTEKENINMLKNAGFKKIESFFKWACFESFIAFK